MDFKTELDIEGLNKADIEELSDYVNDIEDLEGMLDSISEYIGDIGLSLKSHFKSKLKSLTGHSILYRRNKNRLRELLTRYDLKAVKHVPVSGGLEDFLRKDLTIAHELDILTKVLTLELEDFNLDVLHLLDGDREKTMNGLRKGNALDNMAKDIIASGVMDGDKLGNDSFVVSSMYGSVLKGIRVSDDSVRSAVFKHSGGGEVLPLIDIGVFNTVLDKFLGKEDFKAVLGIYRRAIRGTGRYLRDHGDLSSGEVKHTTDAVLYHIDNLVDTLYRKSSIQYKFLVKSLDELESLVVSGTARVTL